MNTQMTMISVTKLLFSNYVVSDIFLYILNDYVNLAFTFLVRCSFRFAYTLLCPHAYMHRRSQDVCLGMGPPGRSHPDKASAVHPFEAVMGSWGSALQQSTESWVEPHSEKK